MTGATFKPPRSCPPKAKRYICFVKRVHRLSAGSLKPLATSGCKGFFIASNKYPSDGIWALTQALTQTGIAGGGRGRTERRQGGRKSWGFPLLSCLVCLERNALHEVAHLLCGGFLHLRGDVGVSVEGESGGIVPQPVCNFIKAQSMVFV